MKPEDVEKLLGRFEPVATPPDLDQRVLEDAHRQSARSPGIGRPEERSSRTRNWGIATIAASFLFVAVALWAILRAPRAPETQGNPSLWEARQRRLVEQAIPVKPTAAELGWRRIPWTIDLGQAIRLAKEDNRPLFVWISFLAPLDRC